MRRGKRKYYNPETLFNVLEAYSEKTEKGYLTKQQILDAIENTRFLHYDKKKGEMYTRTCSNCKQWKRDVVDGIPISTGKCFDGTCVKFDQFCNDFDYKG